MICRIVPQSFPSVAQQRLSVLSGEADDLSRRWARAEEEDARGMKKDLRNPLAWFSEARVWAEVRPLRLNNI